MRKKVLMINGSYRRKNTYNVLVQIGLILKNHGIQTEILDLYNFDIKDCMGCDDLCIRGGGCQIKDDMPAIMQKILDSDGLVLSSPVYLGGVTSKFKAFADRTNAWFHKPEPVGIPVLFVTTTTTTGIKDVIHFFKQFAIGFGARQGGFIARTMKNLTLPVEEKELSNFLSLLGKDKKQYKPAINEIAKFEAQKVLAFKSSDQDKRFWEEKKWNDKYYYYGCKMNFAKKLFSRMMYKILSAPISIPGL